MQTEYRSDTYTKKELLKMLRQLKDRCFLITQHGKPQAVLLSYAAFASLKRKRPTGYELARRRRAVQRILDRQTKFQKAGMSLENVLKKIRNKINSRGKHGLLGH